jgi:hypothetical protein
MSAQPPPFVPAKAGTQGDLRKRPLGSRLRGNERSFGTIFNNN